MIAFVDNQRAVYGVEPICRVLPIAPSTYHEHAARRADPLACSTDAADERTGRTVGEARERGRGLVREAVRGEFAVADAQLLETLRASDVAVHAHRRRKKVAMPSVFEPTSEFQQ